MSWLKLLAKNFAKTNENLSKTVRNVKIFAPAAHLSSKIHCKCIVFFGRLNLLDNYKSKKSTAHDQSLQVASCNSLCAARGRGKRIPIPKNHVFCDFRCFFGWFFNKIVTDAWSSGLISALRSGFEARPTSNGPSSELKRSYEDFRSTLINN